MVPAFAGTVYVPVVKNNDADGVRYETRLWISNEGAQGRSMSTYFIGENTDGTDREDGAIDGRIGVPAGGTVVVGDLADDGVFGLLEVTAAPQLAMQARITTQVQDGPRSLGSPIPVFSSTNLINAGGAARFEPFVKAGSRMSDFYVVNMALEEGQCSIDFFRANGAKLGSTAVITVPPRSIRAFPDVLGLLGGDELGAARGAISCDETFQAFGLTADSATGEVAAILPSALGTSTLKRPDDVPEPMTCPAEAECFELPGDIFVSTRSNSKRQIPVPVTKNAQFGQLVVDFDFVHGGWDSILPDGIHNIGYLTRTGGYSSHTYMFITTRGPNRNFVRAEVTVDLARGANIKWSQPVVLIPGTRYHARYEYNHNGAIILTVTEVSSGRQVVGLVRNEGRRIRAMDGNWRLTFGDNRVEAHVPGTGWSWSSLLIQFIP